MKDKTSLKSNQGGSKLTSKTIIGVMGAFVLSSLMIGAVILFSNTKELSAPQNLSSSNNTSKRTPLKDQALVIQTSEITEVASFYPMEIEGAVMEVLAVKAPDGTIRTAFNTCQVCYSSGRGYYIQQGNVLVCQNCGNRFNMAEVELTKGGCNPVPITSEEKAVTDNRITISQEYLKQSKELFANWKK